MIGIIVADENEIHEVPFKKVATREINQFTFQIYEFNHKEIVMVYSGIGIANAAAVTQELISSFKIKKIFNYGAVGGSTNMNLFDLVFPKEIYFHDVKTPWYERGTTPGEKSYYENGLKKDKNENLASGSSFVFSSKELDNITNDLNVDIFDMETAAIAQIASKNKIELSVIKCVSDIIGTDSSDLEDINTRIKKAGKIALNALIEEIK